MLRNLISRLSGKKQKTYTPIFDPNALPVEWVPSWIEDYVERTRDEDGEEIYSVVFRNRSGDHSFGPYSFPLTQCSPYFDSLKDGDKVRLRASLMNTWDGLYHTSMKCGRKKGLCGHSRMANSDRIENLHLW